MVREIKVSGNWGGIFVDDGGSVVIEPIFKRSFGLAYVVQQAFKAMNEVYNVGRVARGGESGG